MKLYDTKLAPSPRKVRMVIAEKNLDIPMVQVSLRDNEQFDEHFRKLNPRCTVPTLELDDGTCLTESEAICRYLEEIHPEPALFGRTPIERARVNEWIRRVELEGYLAIADTLRNSSDFFVDRALPGPVPVKQIPALAGRGRERTLLFFKTMNHALKKSNGSWLVDNHFSMADIMGFIGIEFAQRIDLIPDDSLTELMEWRQRILQRPSAEA